ncbi:MAG: hypothetical protein OQK54_06040 [Gammaproteobacteria bacterium]|nr:hypothetical protein [Gammaproteobacteria bacterium]
MSEKKVRLYVVGAGDAELQSLIEKGLSELGRAVATTPVGTDCAALLDTLSEDEIPVVIKPYNAV